VLIYILLKAHFISQALVACAYNPSYSGGRDQKDCDLKLAQADGSRDPILKKTQHKNRAGRVAQFIELLSSKYEALSSNPMQKKKKEKREGKEEERKGI
jgi:hypothetical protein